jgi:hypothetical protein
MSNRDAATLTFKTFAIYAFFRALEHAAWLPYRWYRLQPPVSASQVKVPIMAYVILFPPFLLFLAFAIVLWKMAPRLSNSLFSSESRNTESHALSLVDMQRVLFLSIGLFILVDAMPHVIDVILMIYSSSHYPSSPVGASSYDKGKAFEIATILKVSLGLWLVFGNEGLSNIMKKIRNE